MKYNRIVILKDGAECLLRSTGRTDGAEMLKLFNDTHAQTDFLLTYPEENSFDEAQEAEFLATQEASDCAMELCAIVDEKMVGMAGFEPVGTKCKLRHRAEFGISVDQAYRGRGIGKAMTEACIESAKQAGFLQLELEVVADNTAAIALYRKAGFTEFGRNPQGFRTKNGHFQPLVYMRLEL